jgi:hypothetical protein
MFIVGKLNKVNLMVWDYCSLKNVGSKGNLLEVSGNEGPKSLVKGFIRVITKMDFEMAKVNSSGKTNKFIRATGRMEWKMGLENGLAPLVTITRECGSIINNKEKEFTVIKVSLLLTEAKPTKEHLRISKSMAEA